MSTENAKFDLWERKLLDLTLRNNLINMKLAGKVVPVFVPSPSEFEDKLYEDVDFIIKPRNEDESDKKKEEASETSVQENAEAEAEETKDAVEVKKYDFENMHDISAFENLVTESFSKKKLISSMTKSELDNAIKALYRNAKSSLEENGANTLYVAMGVLKWFETGKPTPHYAPIVLVPVDLVRKSIVLGYALRKREDDIQLNVTILEKMRQDFGIVVEGLDPLPQDENGVDINKVFGKIREAIEGQKDWAVLESCYVGLFSFSQFVMWNDLKSRREDILKNKIVNSLVNGRVTWDAEALDSDSKVEEKDVFLPITADASQLYAIKASTSGKSFVLHGPPGSGKSQTITSMIADSMAHGKTVLFAAEKKAALEVVYSRLEKIGLAPFCLELHSNKAKKSHFFEQLKQAVELAKPEKKDEYAKKLAEIEARRKELDHYVDELHSPRSAGMTLYELINVFAANEYATNLDKLDKAFISGVTEDKVSQVEIKLGELIAAGKELGDSSILSFVKTTDYSQQLRGELPSKVSLFNDDTLALKDSFDQIATATEGAGVKLPNDFAGVRIAKSISELMLPWFELPASWSEAAKVEEVLPKLKIYVEKYSKVNGTKADLASRWGEGFFSVDADLLLAKCNMASGKNAISRTLEMNGIYKQVKSFDKTGSGKNTMSNDFSLLVDYKKELEGFNAVDLPEVKAILPEGFEKNVSGVIASADKAIELANKLHEFDKSDSLRTSLAGNIKYKNLWNEMLENYAAFDVSRDNLEEMLVIKPVHDSETFENQISICDDINKYLDKLRDRIALNRCVDDLKTLGVGVVASAYCEGRVSDEDLIPAFRKAYSKELITGIIDSSSVLSSFSGAVFEQKIAEYKKINDEFMLLTRQEVYLRVAHSLPDVVKEASASSALGILQRAIKSGGRGVSIRTLFSQIPDLITKLCPCILMSPMSVAQYIEPGTGIKFDTVIFDEASQLPTCKAVGVIARGDNAIIVGDPNQMPPTSFFKAQNNEDDDYENEDLESILDDCLALSMPQSHLLWHYRSKHESLITFSNKCFYDNRLYTFPSANDRDTKVAFIKCEGTFDRGKTRTNKVEAQAVVDEIIRRAKDPELSKQSLGVVTFNINQQNLIDDLLSEVLSKDSELEQWAYGSEEPIFIKNLENVQGDERDVILFSVGYGCDETGKVYMNFGPLSSDGGWRRLNVAVTRSRCEMMVFSSLEPEQVKVATDTPRGVVAFRKFLEYAKGSSVWDQDLELMGSSSSPVINRDLEFTGIADDIISRLMDCGFKCDRNIGKSGYKVDIGVVDPEDETKYCLGLLLDGPFYRDAKTTGSREIYQEGVLNGLGWKTMRIWTIDWWENPQKLVDSIIARINGNSPKGPDDGEVVEDNKEEVTVEETPVESSPVATVSEDVDSMSESVYKMAELEQQQMTQEEFCSPTNTEYISDLMKQIISEEAPVSEEYLTRRILEACGINRVTQVIGEKCDYLIKYTEHYSNFRIEQEGDKRFFWKAGQSPDTYSSFRTMDPDIASSKRNANDISEIEGANAIAKVLDEQYGMPKENAITEGAKKLGFKRMTESVKDLMNRSFESGINSGKFRIDSRGWAVV